MVTDGILLFLGTDGTIHFLLWTDLLKKNSEKQKKMFFHIDWLWLIWKDIRNILSIRPPIVMAFLDHIFVVWKVTFFKDTTHPSVEYSTHFLWLHKMDFYIFYGSNLKLSIPEISVAISDENKTFSWTSCNQDYSCLSLHHSSQ